MEYLRRPFARVPQPLQQTQRGGDGAASAHSKVSRR